MILDMSKKGEVVAEYDIVVFQVDKESSVFFRFVSTWDKLKWIYT